MNCEARELKSRITQLNTILMNVKTCNAADSERMNIIMTELDGLLYKYIKALGGCKE